MERRPGGRQVSRVLMSGDDQALEPWPEGAALDGAMEAAFHDAVRRHRTADVPMVMWQGGEVRHISPFDIPIPADDPHAVTSRSMESEASGSTPDLVNLNDRYDRPFPFVAEEHNYEQNAMPFVRRLGSHEWRRYRDLRLRALGDSPDAFGGTLEASRQLSDAAWAERLASAAGSEWSLPLVVEEGDAFVGLAWGGIDPATPETAYVIQMWVAPESRGLGCGAMLLDAIVAWARDVGARSVTLSATCGDTPAMRLYLRAGFRPDGDPEPLRSGSALLAQPMRLDL